MVNTPAILDWERTYPWRTRAMVEQDLIICRALVALYNDEYLASHLAFRGGTTLHKLYIQPQQRYSEDTAYFVHSTSIDLVQINAEPIRETIERIRQQLSFLGKPVIKQILIQRSVGKSRRDDTLLTVDFNLRVETRHDTSQQSPAGTTLANPLLKTKKS